MLVSCSSAPGLARGLKTSGKVKPKSEALFNQQDGWLWFLWRLLGATKSYIPASKSQLVFLWQFRKSWLPGKCGRSYTYFNLNTVWFSSSGFMGCRTILCHLKERECSCMPLWHGWEILVCIGVWWLESWMHLMFFFISKLPVIKFLCTQNKLLQSLKFQYVGWFSYSRKE